MMIICKSLKVDERKGSGKETPNRIWVLTNLFGCDKIKEFEKKFFSQTSYEIERAMKSRALVGWTPQYTFTKVMFSAGESEFFINKTIELI